MALMAFILIFVLQFEGVSGQRIPRQRFTLFNRPGDNVILPSDGASASDCSTVTWVYNRDLSQPTIAVIRPNVKTQSVRAARFRLDTNCSLRINNITDEDAGRYTRRQVDKVDIFVYLNILTITPSPPDADPQGDGNITLRCTLLSFDTCRSNSIRWVDETGSVLRGEGVGYKVTAQIDCTSLLTVTRQSGPNRKYTCQRIDGMNNVQIEGHYTSFFIDGFSPPKESNTGWSLLDYVMLILRIEGLFLIPLTVVVVLLLKHRRGNETPPDENNMHNDGDEVAYENVEAPSAATGQH